MVTRIILIALYLMLWFFTRNPEEVIIRVDKGSTAGTLAGELGKEGVLLREGVFLKATGLMGVDRKLKAGTYKFFRNQPVSSIIADLMKGRGILIKMTVPEGWRVDQIAARLDALGITGGEAFSAYADKNQLEGYLFPETYYFPPGDTPERICAVMRKQFNKIFTAKMRKNAASLGLTVKKAVILASIVEREAKTYDEKFLISGIFHNRLRLRWRLESCSTVRYALKKWNRPLSTEDTLYESPYNTYRHRGVPPGPICNPGEVSLRAADFPAETEAMFFLAASSGTHKFSKYFDQHRKKKWKKKREERKDR